MSMPIHFFILLARNFVKYWKYYVINIIGLSIGLAASILIFWYVSFEMSYDSYFSNSDRIYRVSFNRIYPQTEVKWAPIAPAVAEALKTNFESIESYTRFTKNFRPMKFRHQDREFREKRIIYADSTFFSVFNFDVVEGSLDKVLDRPDQLVLTETAARRYFGDEPALGKVLFYSDTVAFTVGAVLRDIPANTHFTTDVIMPMSSFWLPRSSHSEWSNFFAFYSYITLRENTNVSQFEALMRDYINTQMAARHEGESFDKWQASGNAYVYFLQPLTDIHLTSDLKDELATNSNKSYLLLLSAVGIFIIFIAISNFINLTTARLTRRFKEIGIKKIVGASRRNLITQLLSESLILSFFSMLLALIVIYFVLPYFNEIVGKQWLLSTLLTPLSLLGLAAFVILTGLFAGFYPAIATSNTKATEILNLSSKSSTSNKSTLWIRNVLVVSQFCISIVMIIATLVAFRQNEYIQNKDLGFNKSNLLVIDQAFELRTQWQAFKAELITYSFVEFVSASAEVPGFVQIGITFSPPGRQTESSVNMATYFGDIDAIKTYGFQLIKGRDFVESDLADTVSYCILNEEAVKMFGWTPETAIGEILVDFTGQGRIKIIGVMKDFHAQSLHTKIRPMIFRPNNQFAAKLVVRLRQTSNDEIDAIVKLWNKYTSHTPFTYFFLDENLDMLYQSEKVASKLFLIFSLLSIFIACLGLFGLSTFIAEQRIREVGIRKVLGASSTSIVILLLKNYAMLILIAFSIGAPLAWYFSSEWLDHFVYKANISMWIYLMALTIAVVIGLVTVGLQTIKAALTNPSVTLRA